MKKKRQGFNSSLLTGAIKAIKRVQQDPIYFDSLGVVLNAALKELEVAKVFVTQSNKKTFVLDKTRLPKKLQIGGGPRHLDQFLNVDISEPADLVWDFRLAPPLPREYFSYVFTEHFLEHVDYPVAATRVLNNIYRLLEFGGRLFLSVPDAGKVVEAYCKKDKSFLRKLHSKCYSKRACPLELNGDIDLVNYLFRDQIENGSYSVHYWGYDFDSLSKFLKKIGFSKVKRSEYNRKLCNPKREFYSLYIEAIK